jgi:hypothetical protein
MERVYTVRFKRVWEFGVCCETPEQAEEVAADQGDDFADDHEPDDIEIEIVDENC